jgi:hypothetical protein
VERNRERLLIPGVREARNHHARERRLVRESDPGVRIRSLVYAAKSRAKKVGREFDPNIVDVLTVDPPTECPIIPSCGRTLDYGTGNGRSNDSPSIDRIDPTLGYTIENVCIICYRCNRIKNEGTIEDHEGIAMHMRKRIKP